MSYATHPPLAHLVLYQPEIPGNTGAVGRTCVALGAKLWLVRPLGFRIDEKTLRRAGLDYWQYLDWQVVDRWQELLETIPATRFWYLTKRGTQSLYATRFERGDALVFGPETSGLPDSLLADHPRQLLRIPTTPRVRSLNLATSAAICVYEIFRQLHPPTALDLP